MRIVLFPSAYAPAVGGVEELTARLACRLVDFGDEVEVWTIRHPPDLPDDEIINGIRVRRFLLPLPRHAPRAIASFPVEAARAWRKLAIAASGFSPDLIHVQCFSANGVYAAALANRRHVPLVLTLQGETVMDDRNIYDRSVSLRLSLRRSIRAATVVTGCSRFVLEDAERRFGLAPGCGHVIPNGVDLGESTPPTPLNLPFKRFVLGIGRVVHKKGFDLLLEAFRRIAPQHPELGLVIGGDGPVREDLVRRASAVGLGDRVAFPGTLNPSQVAWAMSAAAVFVLPSRVEPFGIVVLEALRAGCPLIVSAHGGATEIVHDGIHAIVTDPWDTGLLAEAIQLVLSDDRLAKRLCRAGPERAADFDWELIARRYREIYKQLGADPAASEGAAAKITPDHQHQRPLG
jgi:glycosyltransferase involved in cell wall biosynthesis